MKEKLVIKSIYGSLLNQLFVQFENEHDVRRSLNTQNVKQSVTRRRSLQLKASNSTEGKSVPLFSHPGLQLRPSRNSPALQRVENPHIK